MKQKDLLIVIPVYNEEKNIRRVLEALLRPEIMEIADVLVVDDASRDHSGESVRKRGCNLITHPRRLGYGRALRSGYQYALQRGYRYVIQMDADGQHDPCNIPVIYRRLKERTDQGREPDLVLASRFMAGSSDFPVSPVRKFAFALFRAMIFLATGRRIADPTTGLQGLGRRAFAWYAVDGHFDDRYPDANMVLQMLLLQFCVVEQPAVMHAREDGKSMHAGLEPAWYMIRMVLSVLAVTVRIKVLKKDAGAGLKDVECGQEKEFSESGI